MATRAVQQVVECMAWDTVNNTYKTGDSANIALSWVKDGTRSATTNAVAEVDSTNCPGLYKVTLTSTETDCLFGALHGKSTTANIVIIPVMIGFIYANTSAPATAGIPDVNAKNINNATAPTLTGDAFARLGAPVGASTSADIASVQADTDNIQTRLPAALDANGFMKADVEDWKGATAPAMTGDAFARLGAPAGASVSADIAAIKAVLPAALDANGFIKADVEDWKGATAPANTGDAFARLGAPAGATVSADIAAVEANAVAIKAKTDNLPASPAATGDAMALTAAERILVADVLLNRDMGAGSDTGSATVRTPRQALRALRNKVDASTATLSVFKEDDATVSWQSALTTDVAALPVTISDPAGP